MEEYFNYLLFKTTNPKVFNINAHFELVKLYRLKRKFTHLGKHYTHIMFIYVCIYTNIHIHIYKRIYAIFYYIHCNKIRKKEQVLQK